MHALPESPPAVAPPLQFSCGHCGTVLSVPAALAGIQGPCPSCRRLIMAPGGTRPEARSLRPVLTAPTPVPVPPQPRLPRPPRPPSGVPTAPPTALIPASNPPSEERRSSLRRRAASESAARSTTNERPSRRERSERESKTSGTRARGASRIYRWTWAGVGSVVGGGLVFAGLSAARLKRDTSPPPAPAVASRPATENDDDALAALAAHKKASARELKSLLASQQTVWRLFAATSAEEAQPLISEIGHHSLPADGLHSPLTGLTLRSKRRLPDDTGTTSQWAVTTARFGELIVDVTDATGQPKVNWDTLAVQLGAQPPTPDQRTAAAP